MSDQVQLEHPALGPKQRIWVTEKQAKVKAKSGWVEVEEVRSGETMAELRDEASEANIKGRSSMDKDELVTALTEEDSKNQPED